MHLRNDIISYKVTFDTISFKWKYVTQTYVFVHGEVQVRANHMFKGLPP